jgi:hypothetical protein
LAAVKQRLRTIEGLRPSAQEPSVYLPAGTELIEVNFLGLDPAIREADETYVLEDAELPLAGLLATAVPSDLDEAARVSRGLSAESRHAVASNLTVLSLMEARPGMPDPAPVRAHVGRLLDLVGVHE